LADNQIQLKSTTEDLAKLRAADADAAKTLSQSKQQAAKLDQDAGFC